jgi:hypothetical protein
LDQAFRILSFCRILLPRLGFLLGCAQLGESRAIRRSVLAQRTGDRSAPNEVNIEGRAGKNFTVEARPLFRPNGGA